MIESIDRLVLLSQEPIGIEWFVSNFVSDFFLRSRTDATCLQNWLVIFIHVYPWSWVVLSKPAWWCSLVIGMFVMGWIDRPLDLLIFKFLGFKVKNIRHQEVVSTCWCFFANWWHVGMWGTTTFEDRISIRGCFGTCCYVSSIACRKIWDFFIRFIWELF